MTRVELTTLVRRLPDEAFEYLANFENLPEHEPWVETVARTSDRPTGGAWTHVRRMSGQRIAAPIELFEYGQNRRLTIITGSVTTCLCRSHRFPHVRTEIAVSPSVVPITNHRGST